MAARSHINTYYGSTIILALARIAFCHVCTAVTTGHYNADPSESIGRRIVASLR